MDKKLLKLKNELEKLINSSSKVFIIGHNEPDFDAIASSIGIQVLATHLKKNAYIVVNDMELESGVNKIINANKDKYSIINKNEYKKLVNNNSILIMCDVNKKYLISLKKLDKFKNIAIIDHHKEDNFTVNTQYKYIDISKSSVSEIVTHLLSSYKKNLIDPVTANCLLSGIVLDTQRFRKNTTTDTLTAAKILIKNGAKTDYVEDLFLSEFEEDKKINNLVFSNTIFRNFEANKLQNKNIAFVLNRQKPETIYKREELAKAADKLLKYKVDASFALGYITDKVISISGRSKSDIDVSDILSTLNNVQGGGNPTSAGAKAININVLDLEKSLIKRTTDYLKQTHDNPYVLKKIKKF